MLSAAALSSSCSDKLVLGEQCPSPERSESAPALDGSFAVYGTSCAPCRAPELDDQGCPVYVTVETCGGPICVGDIMIPMLPEPGEEDAGSEDASMSQEDGGAD